MNNAHDDGQTNGATMGVAIGIAVAALIVGAILWAMGDGPVDDGRRGGSATPPVLRTGLSTSRALMPASQAAGPASRAAAAAAAGTATSRAAPLAVGVASAPAKVAPATVGAIKGRVVWKGMAPKLKEIDLSGREPRCIAEGGAPLTEEHTIIAEDGGLKNVIVYIKSGPATLVKSPVPTTPVILDQLGCRYVPHALAWRAGQPLELRNSDPFGHNVHSGCVLNQGGNETLDASGGGSVTKVLMIPELFRYSCEVHPWMSAYVGVFAHDFFAVTDADGAFSWANVPAGEHVLEATHEKWAKVTARIRVFSNTTTDVTFALEDN